MPEAANVQASGKECGAPEEDRAKSALGALARELDKSGFVLVDPKNPEDAAKPSLALDLAIVLDDCERGLFGDVALTLTSTAGQRVDRIAMDDVWFSNIAGLANDLADRIARSSTVAEVLTRRGGK